MGSKILIVDDSPTLRASVKFALKKEGHTVKQAKNGKDGLSKLESEGKFDLIVTDINMPKMDGITFIKEVKETKYKFTPIVVLTTESESSKKMEGKKAGAAGWIVKPFKEKQLKYVVSKFVR